MDSLLRNENIKSILIFPLSGNPEEAARRLRQYTLWPVAKSDRPAAKTGRSNYWSIKLLVVKTGNPC